MASKGVFITGASAGIGRALALEYAKSGEFNLALVARRLEKLNEVKKEIEAINPNIKVEVRQLDVSHFADIKPIFNELAIAIGSIDIVVANAGGLFLGRVGSGTDINKAIEFINTTYSGAIFTIDAAVEYFKTRGTEKGGHVVGISSTGAFKGYPGLAISNSAKAGISLFLEVLDQEVRHQNINVTTIYAGPTETDLTAAFKGYALMLTPEQSAQKIIQLVKAKASQGIVAP